MLETDALELPRPTKAPNARTVALASGGTITLTVAVDAFTLTENDLTLLRHLNAILSGYEEAQADWQGVTP